MKKGIFSMFILVASMAMVACTGANQSTKNFMHKTLILFIKSV